MDNIQKIPFRVSARTARLIGRENIATSKGAIIELVKNAYDADSRICIIYFDNFFNEIHQEISESSYLFLIDKSIPLEILTKVYKKTENGYSLRDTCSDEDKNALKRVTLKLSSLYIIDAGEGMTEAVIRNNWMTIGTDNKAYNYFTKTGRVKAGAKGIGRFALDKLGSKCEMTTIFNPIYHQEDVNSNYNGYKWVVNWEDFEGEFKTIENVNADLSNISNKPLVSYIKEILPVEIFQQIPNVESFQYGTILKVLDLRENWEEYYVTQVFSDLEVLVPPKESGGFTICLYNSLDISKYGEVLGSICDDFDYKIVAKGDDKQNVDIRIYRNEYDVDIIPMEFFQRPNMQQSPYTRDVFRQGYWETQKTFGQLIKGFNSVDTDNTFNDIGVFEFTFYFMKRTYASDDAEKFYYKKFMSNYRKEWLAKFGGIKLFRDSFRVRPYGEAKDVAFDWLGLGGRKALSPAGIAKADGGYRVEPENVTGAIGISRLTNVNFEDKSSREGLQENKTFQIFKSLIISIIGIFELDRSYIAREMAAFYADINSERISQEEAEKLVKKILEDNRTKKATQRNDPTQKALNTSTNEENERIILAELNEKKDEQIEKLKDEQKLLRGLASSGIVLASFSHDLSKLEQNMLTRVDKVKGIISEHISEKQFSGIEDRKNPFYLLERIKKNDLKLKNWLSFSLGSTRKDKRKRKQLFFDAYFSNFSKDWGLVLEERGITLNTKEVQSLDMRVFEIDMDSIFNNLLVNSIEAFNVSKIDRAREIKLSIYSNGKETIIDYLDSGPGLSSDIDNPNEIFTPLFTTKRDRYTGEEIGTGLGMWLVKSITEENDGKVTLLYPQEGFGLRISFPIKYKK